MFRFVSVWMYAAHDDKKNDLKRNQNGKFPQFNGHCMLYSAHTHCAQLSAWNERNECTKKEKNKMKERKKERREQKKEWTMDTKKCIIDSIKLHTKIDQFYLENNLKGNYRQKQMCFSLSFRSVLFCFNSNSFRSVGAAASVAVVWRNFIPNFLFSFCRIEWCSLLDDLLFVKRDVIWLHRLSSDSAFVDSQISFVCLAFVVSWKKYCRNFDLFWIATKREKILP